jgi:hypothetical protein
MKSFLSSLSLTLARAASRKHEIATLRHHLYFFPACTLYLYSPPRDVEKYFARDHREGGRAVHAADRPFRKTRKGLAVTESYCPVCGLFIAASPRPQVLALAEKLHRCHLLNVKPPHDEAGLAAARIVAYAFGKKNREHLPRQSGLWPLMGKLARCEHALQQWLKRNEANARWFRKDPIAALRSADLGIEEEVLLELESLTRAIAQKLKPSH